MWTATVEGERRLLVEQCFSFEQHLTCTCCQCCSMHITEAPSRFCRCHHCTNNPDSCFILLPFLYIVLNLAGCVCAALLQIV